MSSRSAVVVVTFALISLSCYQTTTSDRATVRTNSVTGQAERLIGDKWVPIKEATVAPPPVSLVEDRHGQPCRTAPAGPGESWLPEIEEQARTGCISNRAGSTTRP
jgi:hypothetical protein